MKHNIRILLTVVSLFAFQGLYADKVHNGGKTANTNSSNGSNNFQNSSVNKETAESCVPASGSTELTINNVRARINTGGDMWWDLQSHSKYYIPKNTTNTSMYSGSLWIGGVDINGQLKVAALRYRQVGNDYWPGPLTNDATASVDAATCKKYDKHFMITRAEVDEYRSHLNENGTTNFGSYRPPLSIQQWPGNGAGSAGGDGEYLNSSDHSQFLAPFFDRQGDGIYDWTDGDYPYYDISNALCPKFLPVGDTIASGPEGGTSKLVDQVLKGDQTAWWVFNDKGNVHTESKGSSIGLEIRAQAFAFATNDEVNNMTFYSYEIINRSTYQLTETYFSQWVDTDLGYAYDDFVGCDVTRGLGYCYNGKNIDGAGEPEAYGTQPPAIGVDFFQGPYMDPDGLDNPKGGCDVSINGVNFGDNIIDNERFGMRRFVYHNNGGAFATSDPEIAPQYYNLLRGIWKDGTKMLYGNNAHKNSGAYGPECDFMFPGDTDPCDWGTGGLPPNGQKYWTEETAQNPPSDRRFMQSAGPFTLMPGAVNYITVGVPWARATSGGPFASVQLLRQVDDKCQRLFDNCFKVVNGPDAPDLTIQELDRELILYISNKSISNNYKEKFVEYDPNIVSPDSLVGAARYDSLYRFEGYQIYQLVDGSISATDIYDTDKARLVFQCDLKNGVSKLVNYSYSEALGANVPQQMVDGADVGITHSFRVFEDQFATNDKRLVNHKQYYFMAVAYAYNEYFKYSQDPNILNGLNGQKKPFLPGRKNGAGGAITATTGIPHNPSPEAGGTVMNCQYGDGPKIKRIEGQGNGGMNLELTDETVNEILAGYPHHAITPLYKNNQGPIDVKVIDPLNVKKGNYTLKFNKDSLAPNDLSLCSWTLINNDDLTQWESDQSILNKNEQIFLDLGLSVTIQQVMYPGYDTLSLNNNGLIESSITYADSSKRWFSGIPDVDAGAGKAFNWIRSGVLVDEANGTNNDYDWSGVGSGKGLDKEQIYEKVIGGTWAPYRLTSRYTNGPMWSEFFGMNDIRQISSIDVVLTSDKSKWSKCPVIEMCEDPVLAMGGAKKFDLRKSASLDVNGNEIAGSTGMGYFPGYAINVETGERLNIMFGEDSWLVGDNGRDMKFNPTSNYADDLYFATEDEKFVKFGGKHYLYIMGHYGDDITKDCPAYDEGSWIYSMLYNSVGTITKRAVYKDVMWTTIPMAVPNTNWLDNDVKIRIRVKRPYMRNYWTTAIFPSTVPSSATNSATSPQNDNYPMYSFSTDDIATSYGVTDTATSALDMINVVPNPYYAYSQYEVNQLDNRIKITNLPEKCVVSIYTVNGTLVRQFKKDEVKTSLDWDLKNHAGIPIAGGVYLIHVKADGIGEKVIKWFGSLRPTDLNSF
ncbi:MAG: T9SS C-terminal target domain-containing protein [Bacteroidetes bacterium]|nr:T9SS C-terminal target domain-containing protein [Bacteroidota bacterium]